MTAMTEIRLGPMTDTKMITSSSGGMLSTVSVKRITNWSIAPPNGLLPCAWLASCR